MKKVLLILFIIPAALLLYLEANRSSVEEWAPAPPDMAYPSLVREQWMGIYYKGKKLGFSYTATFKGDKGFKSRSRAVVKLSSSGSIQETSFNNEATLSKERELLHFNFAQDMAGHRQVVEGVRSDGKIALKISSAGAVSRKEVSFPKGSVTGYTLPYYLMARGLTPGNKYSVNLFIEPLQTMISINISIIGVENLKNLDGKTVKTYKVEQNFNGLKAYSWLTEEGLIMKEHSLEGLVSVMETREEAIKFAETPLSVSSFINFSLIRTARRVENQGELEEIRIRVGGLRKTARIPEDGRQWVEDIFTHEGGAKTAAVTINRDYVRGGSEAPTGSEYLAPTPEIQSDYPEIITRASQITRGEEEIGKEAGLILRWVHGYMKKKPVDTFTAADALHSGEGECQSHTNLFAALARASGIPTRVASGLVYSENAGGFLYHAWPEVYVGHWVAMDPTFGQEVADPTHIKLSTGGWAKQLSLLKFIGKINIEIVEVVKSTEAAEEKSD